MSRFHHLVARSLLSFIESVYFLVEDLLLSIGTIIQLPRTKPFFITFLLK